MQKRMGDFLFRLMSMEFRIKGLFSDLEENLRRSGLEEGMSVLDFGCGPGRYTIPAARLVGAKGRVYAVDLHPLALEAVERSAKRHRISNIQTMLSDGALALADESLDFVLLYDVLHDVDNRTKVVRELLRVLRPNGILSYRDHSLDAESTWATVIETGFLRSPENHDGVWTYVRTSAPERSLHREPDAELRRPTGDARKRDDPPMGLDDLVTDR